MSTGTDWQAAERRRKEKRLAELMEREDLDLATLQERLGLNFGQLRRALEKLGLPWPARSDEWASRNR